MYLLFENFVSFVPRPERSLASVVDVVIQCELGLKTVLAKPRMAAESNLAFLFWRASSQHQFGLASSR
jgi:hypothetical protein